MQGPHSDPEQDRHAIQQARLVALVLLGTVVCWIGVQWLGGVMGWPARFAFLADMLAAAGFTWALIVTYRIWRKRQSN